MVRRYKHPWLYITHLFEVPVIVVFTKYDQFVYNVAMHLFDYPSSYPESDPSVVAEKRFQKHYLHPLGNDIRFVRLKSGFEVKCYERKLTFLGRNARAK